MAKDTAVFLALSTKHPVYANYTEAPDSIREEDIPLVLMISRWDGYLGFPGGYCDDGETLPETAIREAYEELGVVLTEDEKRKMKIVSQHEIKDGNLFVVLYSLEIDFIRMMQVVDNVKYAPHYLSEVCGVILQQFQSFDMRDGRKKGLNQFVKHNFAPTVVEQLKDLNQFLGLEKIHK